MDLKDFYEQEFKLIAEAHFNVSQRITSFFQYMLLIYSAPLVLLTNKLTITDDSVKGPIFIFISIIGLFVLMYMSQLRCESLLYARTENGIRSFCYDQYRVKVKEVDYKTFEKYRVLPIQKMLPSYNDNYQFIWIILSISLIDSGYLIYGLFQLKSTLRHAIVFTFFNNSNVELIDNRIECLLAITVLVIFILLHILLEAKLTKKLEAGLNIYKHRVGIDIDGVLNKHEQQFSKVYTKIKNKPLDPETIKTLPVRYSNIGVTEPEERDVFGQKEYWIDMPPADDISKVKDLHEMLGYELYIFTWRDWGQGKFDIKGLTKTWLNKYIDKKVLKKITFEEGNIDHPVGINKHLYMNRFYLSKKYKIKYFIEDELPKALKLSQICNFVILINHKYNEVDDQLPYNIIRVNNLDEAFTKIKDLG